MDEGKTWEDYGLTPMDAAPPLSELEYVIPELPQNENTGLVIPGQYQYTILDIAREELRERYGTAFTDSGTSSMTFAQWLNSKHPLQRVNVQAFTGAPQDARLVLCELVRGNDFVFSIDLTNNTARPVSFYCGAVRDIYSHELVIPPNLTYAREDDSDPGVLLLDRGHGVDYMAQEALNVFGTLLLVQWSMRLEGKWPWGGPAVEQALMRSY